MKFLFILLVPTFIALYLLIFQHKMIYFPRSYTLSQITDKRVVELDFQSSQGKQTSFYVMPRSGSSQDMVHLWLLFGGNAALALDWMDFISRYPDQQTGFLLVDYPGYGKCEGRASPGSILESTKLAVQKLSERMNMDLAALENHMSLLGHSLGAAAALQYAAGHRVNTIVLISPFTSLRDMAVRVVGKPLHMLLMENFDNEAHLSELVKRNPLPRIAILHGDMDEIIPVKMGRKLGKMFPDIITYQEIKNGDHNTILLQAEGEIYQAMLGETVI